MRFFLLASALAGALAASACSIGPTVAPPAPAATAKASKDIVDTAVAAGSFKTLVAAVQAAGLEGTLRSAGPFTVFAPTDAAFAALPAGTVADLLKPENKAKLTAVLTYHVLPGNIPSSAVAGKTTEVKTVEGKTVKVVGSASGVTVNDAKVVSADVKASNGVIHVIDKVLLPPM